jgi:hypothetical protein
MTIEEKRAKKAAQQRTWRARHPERVKAIAAAYWKTYYEKNKSKLYENKILSCTQSGKGDALEKRGLRTAFGEL